MQEAFKTSAAMARRSSNNSGSIPMILIDIGARSRDMPKGSLWRSAAIDIEGGKTVMSMQAFLRDREALLSGGARAVEIEPVYMGTYSLDPKTAAIVPKYQVRPCRTHCTVNGTFP